MGKHPLRRVRLRVIDVPSFRRLVRSKKMAANEVQCNDAIRITEVGDVVGGMTLYDPIGMDTGAETEKRYDIEVYAINGRWREYFRVRNVAGRLEHAIKVVPMVLLPNGRDEGDPIYSEVSDGFPRLSGEVDWNN
jgi:hypothetical protein